MEPGKNTIGFFRKPKKENRFGEPYIFNATDSCCKWPVVRIYKSTEAKIKLIGSFINIFGVSRNMKWDRGNESKS